MAHNRAMTMYVFLKDFGNKKAGDKSPLSPEAVQFLSGKGIIKRHGGEPEKAPKEPKVTEKPTRKKKK